MKNESSNILSAIGLDKAYRNPAGGMLRHVFSGLSLDVQAGEMIAIMGPSGSGKTTLLNLFGTLDTPDRGDIFIEGRALKSMEAKQLPAFRNVSLGFVFQFHHLLPQCTLLENILLPAIPAKQDKNMVLSRAEELLNFLGIWNQRHQKPATLSGGECQRAAVARALINQPKIILADEPTGSLDANNAERLTDLLVQVNNKMGVTMILATHAMPVAERMDKIYRIIDGALQPS